MGELLERWMDGRMYSLIYYGVKTHFRIRLVPLEKIINIPLYVGCVFHCLLFVMTLSKFLNASSYV